VFGAKLGLELEACETGDTNYKGIKYNAYFEQITGIQEKLDTTCK